MRPQNPCAAKVPNEPAARTCRGERLSRYFFNVETSVELWWVILGLGAQVMFGLRFIVQWLHSERAGRSVIPLSFWYFSVAGGILMLAYAIYRHQVENDHQRATDAVFGLTGGARSVIGHDFGAARAPLRHPDRDETVHVAIKPQLAEYIAPHYFQGAAKIVDR